MKKFAFLTGINQYGILPILKYARQDAQAVADALRTNYQFTESEITLMTDQEKGFLMPMTKQVIENRLRELEGTNPDLFIFGFWGHGFFEDQLYFCPMGVDKQNITQDGFSMSQLTELIGKIGAKSAFLILDCCQNQARRGGIDQVMSPDNEASLANAARDIVLRLQKNKPRQSSFVPNIAILNSCRVGQCAYEWDDRHHGVFTAHLLEAFNQRLSSVGQITDLLGRQVAITAKRLGYDQQPFFQMQGSVQLPVVEQKDGKIYVHLPERAENMQILTPTIDDINITVVPVGSMESQTIDSTVIQLPPIPAQLVQIRAENAGLDEAIERLKSDNHPALAQAQQVVQTVKAQVDALAQKKVQKWKAFVKAGGDVQKLETWIQENPKEPAISALDLCPEVLDVATAVDLILWGQNWLQACEELKQVEKQYCQKREEKIDELAKRKEANCLSVVKVIDQLQTSALMTILAAMPQYSQLEQPLPERNVSRLILELNKYQMGWNDRDLFKQATILWNNNRPVVIEKREAEQRRIKFLIAGFIILCMVAFTWWWSSLPKTLKGHDDGVLSVSYSPNGRFIASGGGFYDNTVRIWNAQTGECVKTLEGHEYGVNSVSCSPDGRFIASGSFDNTVRIWNAQTNECVKTLEHEDSVRSVSYSPDGRFIASGSEDDTVRIWNAQTGECVKTLEGHEDSVHSVSYSPDGRFIASGSDDNTVHIWNAQTGECVKTLEHKDSVWSVSYSPDGRFIASGSFDKTVRIWNAQTGEYMKTLQGHEDYVSSVSYSPDGRFIASGSADTTVRIWNLKKQGIAVE